VTPDKGYVPQIWETAYISEVNRAKKVKSDAQVVMNKISDPHAEIFFFRGGWGTVPPTDFFPNL